MMETETWLFGIKLNGGGNKSHFCTQSLREPTDVNSIKNYSKTNLFFGSTFLRSYSFDPREGPEPPLPRYRICLSYCRLVVGKRQPWPVLFRAGPAAGHETVWNQDVAPSCGMFGAELVLDRWDLVDSARHKGDESHYPPITNNVSRQIGTRKQRETIRTRFYL